MSKPRAWKASGRAWGTPGELPERHPAYRRREPGSGVSVERAKRRPDTAETEGPSRSGPSDRERESPQAADPQGAEYRCGGAVADCPVVAEKPDNAGGAKGAGHPGLVEGQLPVQEEPTGKPKPFAISKQIVWEA